MTITKEEIKISQRVEYERNFTPRFILDLLDGHKREDSKIATMVTERRKDLTSSIGSQIENFISYLGNEENQCCEHHRSIQYNKLADNKQLMILAKEFLRNAIWKEQKLDASDVVTSIHNASVPIMTREVKEAVDLIIAAVSFHNGDRSAVNTTPQYCVPVPREENGWNVVLHDLEVYPGRKAAIEAIQSELRNEAVRTI